MRNLLLASALLAATLAGPAFAQSSKPAAATGTNAQGSATSTQASPAANAALQVATAFMADLAGGQLEAARQLMTADAVVMANGQVLGDRDTYINGAAKGDAAALRTAKLEVLRREAKAGPNFVWVMSEKQVTSNQAGAQAPAEVVTETMLIARTDAGWKIAHIHWSGRHAG